MQEWQDPTGGAVLVAGVVLVALVVGLVAVLARVRRVTGAAVREALARSADLQARLDELERRLAAPRPTALPTDHVGVPAPEFVITDLGRSRPDAAGPAGSAPAERPGGALFADLVLRESVVKAVSWAHGVRRAVQPDARDRIRLAVRREVKRSRKARRAQVRAARRVLRADGAVGLDRLEDRRDLGDAGSAA